MVQRLTGPNAISATQLAKETRLQQGTLSRWLMEARTLPHMAREGQRTKRWSVENKARIISKAATLSGSELEALLHHEGATFAELEQWRLALADDGRPSTSTTKRIRALERELARKEKALAEAAALLVLKKKVDSLGADEDDDTSEETER